MGEGLEKDSGSEWEEKAQSEVDISMLEAKRAGTPGGFQVGEACWLWHSLENLAAEVL